MEWLVPAGIAAGSLALTYFLCLRPMRRGHCMLMADTCENDEDAERAEIARLRAEIAEINGLRGTSAVAQDSSGSRPSVS